MTKLSVATLVAALAVPILSCFHLFKAVATAIASAQLGEVALAEDTSLMAEVQAPSSRNPRAPGFLGGDLPHAVVELLSLSLSTVYRFRSNVPRSWRCGMPGSCRPAAG